MTTEKKIAKIIKKTEVTSIAIAEGMEWKFIPKPLLSQKEINEGDYVWVYILRDEEKDEFYLEESQDGFATKEEWIEQEKMYLQKK